jgi:hypothetical protein
MIYKNIDHFKLCKQHDGFETIHIHLKYQKKNEGVTRYYLPFYWLRSGS